MNEDAIITAAAALSGVIVTSVLALISQRIAWRRDRRHDDHELLRTKLEELCEVCESIGQVYRAAWSELGGLLQSPSESTANRPIAPARWSRLSMLVLFYAPDLRPALDAALSAREAFSVYLKKAFTPENLQRLDATEYQQQLDAGVKSVLAALDHLQTEAAGQFRKDFEGLRVAPNPSLQRTPPAELISR